MKGQPNRLAAETAGPFGGNAIDRSQTLQFRLNGRTIAGFVGDTVLSAVLAAGIDTVGERNGSALALTGQFAPAIAPAALANDPQRALAMGRTQVVPGAEYVTLGPSRRHPMVDRARMLLARPTTLGLNLDQPGAMRRPWTTLRGSAAMATDVIVVGGGAAGMAAAIAASQAGLSVMVLEASARLGGYAHLFGTLDGEETSDASFTRLGASIAGAGNVTVVTHATVFGARPGVVRAHIIETDQSGASPRIVDLQARHIVLANGSLERLPVFAGNRLPGTVGVREAYDLAHNYGVWCGQSALMATVSSAAYRLAMMARDAGIEVPRIIDARQQPQSRFVEYSKAYGITLAAGTIIAQASAAQGRGLAVTSQLSVAGFTRTEPGITVDRLVLCGGWQPDLDLWHMAGGTSRFNPQTQRLEAEQGPEGIVLAGNAAGYHGHHACLQSGQAAIDTLLGRAVSPVWEHGVDPIYESPDAPTPVADASQTGAPSYLDGGRSLVARPRPPRRALPGWWPLPAHRADWQLADGPQALDSADVAAGVQLGAIVADEAGGVARNRVALVPIALPSAQAAPAPSRTPMVPDYLKGRFGAAAQVWVIKAGDGRRLEAGALIQPHSDASDPLHAIGVVLGQDKAGPLALLSAAYGVVGNSVVVRETGRATAIRLVGRHEPAQA